MRFFLLISINKYLSTNYIGEILRNKAENVLLAPRTLVDVSIIMKVSVLLNA